MKGHFNVLPYAANEVLFSVSVASNKTIYDLYKFFMNWYEDTDNEFNYNVCDKTICGLVKQAISHFSEPTLKVIYFPNDTIEQMEEIFDIHFWSLLFNLVKQPKVYDKICKGYFRMYENRMNATFIYGSEALNYTPELNLEGRRLFGELSYRASKERNNIYMERNV